MSRMLSFMVALSLAGVTISAASAGELYDFGNPGPQAELMRQAIHRARLDPEAEADRLGLENMHPDDVPDGAYDIGEGLPIQPVADQRTYWSRYQGPRQVLAWNGSLMAAARNHSDDMYTYDFFAHETQQSGHGYSPGDKPWDRAYAEGYPNHYVGENIAVNDSAGSYTAQDVHDAFFAEPEHPGRPHRRALLYMRWREIGVGYVSRSPNAGEWTDYWTVDFGSDWYWTGDPDPWPTLKTAFVTGVVFADDGDGLYQPGEQLPGVQVTVYANGAKLKYKAVTADGGGYTVPLLDAAGAAVPVGSEVRAVFFDPAQKRYTEVIRTIVSAELRGEDDFEDPLVQTERLNIGVDVLASALLPAIAGDANLDGCVDGLDYNIWSLNYLQAGGWLEGNFNDDGVADGLDYNIWSLNYQMGCEAAAVPGPSCALLLVAGVWAVRRRWGGAGAISSMNA